MKTYIGIDNGVSGTMAILSEEGATFIKTPVKKVQDYTKRKKLISRLDTKAFAAFLEAASHEDCFALIERPMVNPTRFTATESALRCHEAMLGVIELMGIPYAFCDSKEWQRVMLPKGYADGETKMLSLEMGNRLFPKFRGFKHPDRDALLIAEYARRAAL